LVVRKINEIMKMKGLILLLIFFGGVSCDISKPLIIDGQREYVLFTECGPIKIKGSSFSTLVIVGSRFNGKYHINRDSLKIKAFSDEDTITNIRFELDNKELMEKEIETKHGETLTVLLNYQSTVPYQRASGTILLFPSNFITCEGKAVITDTIKIQLKNGR
jgi:lipoprotein